MNSSEYYSTILVQVPAYDLRLTPSTTYATYQYSTCTSTPGRQSPVCTEAGSQNYRCTGTYQNLVQYCIRGLHADHRTPGLPDSKYDPVRVASDKVLYWFLVTRTVVQVPGLQWYVVYCTNGENIYHTDISSECEKTSGGPRTTHRSNRPRQGKVITFYLGGKR